jgi:antitoxin MazE
VELTIVKKQITITPLSATHWSLDELLAGITKDNLHAEIDTGVAIGNEMW